MFFYPMTVVGCQLSGVGVDCRFYPSMVVVYCWVVGCRLSGADCRLSVQLSVVVVGSWLSGVGCRFEPSVAQLFHCRCPALGSMAISVFRSLNISIFFCMIPFLVPLLTEKRGQNQRRKTILT